MGRSNRSPIMLGPGLTLIVALLVVGSTSLRSPADEPTPKAAEEKTPDPKKIEAAAKHKDAALKAAEVYLVLLDKGKYAESWETHSSHFRNGLPRQKWVEALNKTRRPFGRLQSRKLSRIAMRATKNPERIDQAWVYSNLVFQSGWNNAELVTLYFESGKEWKVSGYHIGDLDFLPKLPEDEKDAMDEEENATKPAAKNAKKATKSTKN